MEILINIAALVIGWLLVGWLVGVKKVYVDGGLTEYEAAYLQEQHPGQDVRAFFTERTQMITWTCLGFFGLVLDLRVTLIRLTRWLFS